MDIEKAYDLVSSGGHEAIQKAINAGFNVNVTDGVRVSLAEFASFSDDRKMLHILWSAGAKATTPHIENIFSEFKSGKIDEIDSQKKSPPLSNNHEYELNLFSLAKVPIIKIGFDESSFALIIQFDSFKIENDIITEPLVFELKEHINLKDLKKGKTFVKDQITSSIYLQGAHNPVDLKYIKTSKKLFGPKALEVHILVDFEHEGTGLKNERIVIKKNVP
jgi:hypothetical protein